MTNTSEKCTTQYHTVTPNAKTSEYIIYCPSLSTVIYRPHSLHSTLILIQGIYVDTLDHTLMP